MVILKRNYLYISVLAMLFAALTDAFSTSALSLAAYDMQGNLNATNDEFIWLNILYLGFKLTAFISTSSILERFDTLKVVKFVTIILIISCTLSSLTTDIYIQYVLRSIQGFIGGILLVSTQTFLFQNFEKKIQPFIQSFYAIGAIIVPATFISGFNGFILDYFSWEALYLATIPSGLFALFVLSFIYEENFKQIRIRKFDIVGLLLFMIFIFPTMYVLYQGNRYNWFDEVHILILSILGISSLICFILWQIFKEDSIIETKIFQTNTFNFGIFVALVAGAVLFGSGSVLTSFNINVLGLTLSQSGSLFFYSGFTFLLSVFFTAFLIQVLSFSPAITIPFGLLIFSLSMYFMSQSNFYSGFDELLLPLLLRGFAMGLLFLSLTLITLNLLPTSLVVYGIGIFSINRQLGGTTNVGVLNTFIKQDNAQNANILSSHIVENDPIVINWLNQYSNILYVDSLDEQTSRMLLSKALNEQVLTISYSNAFLYLVSFILIAIPCIILVKNLLAKFNPAPKQ